MKKSIIYITFLCLGSMIASCDLKVSPTDKYDQETFWYGSKTANAGLVGCYSALRDQYLYGNASILWEEAASPNAFNYDNRVGWNSIALGTQTPDLSIFANRWKAAYTGVGRCNFLLDNIDKSKTLSQDEIGQMKAQARFLRALFYQILITYYDKVPLITEAPNLDQGALGRTDREEIVTFLVNELDEVAGILPPRYTSASDLGKATKGAALALKARLLLFEASPLFSPNNDRDKWQAAANAAKAVMDLGMYDLYPAYRGLFSASAENGSETIFDVQYISEPGMGSSFDVTLRQFNNSAPLRDLIDAYWMLDGKPKAESTAYQNSADYENRDPRFKQTIVYPGSQFMGETVKPDGSNINFKVIQTGYTYKKYTIYDAETPPNEVLAIGENYSEINYMILRYADILLMYAEAKNELGELTEDVWNNTIKPIRQRAGFSAASALNYPGNDATELTKHIRYERRIEFAGEGYYYNDIRRWKTAEVDMNTTIKKFDGSNIITRTFNKDRDYWWSVPSTQLEMNPALKPNNPGWGQ